MEVQTWDSVFVRATRRSLHPVIADVAQWGRWWPGMSVFPAPGGHRLALRAPGMTTARQLWTARLVKQRPALGIHLEYAGQLRGEAELYYLDERAGTVVHYVLRGKVADRGWRRAVRRHRAGVRAGLDALKDRLEGARAPGDEPDPKLLAEQQDAIAAFNAAVVAGRQRRAAAGAGARA